MRNYLDIIIDVRDGKKVDYEEIRVALMFCRDMLFFTESDLKKVIDTDNKLVKEIIKGNMDSRFYAKKKPIEEWWKGNIPKIIE